MGHIVKEKKMLTCISLSYRSKLRASRKPFHYGFFFLSLSFLHIYSPIVINQATSKENPQVKEKPQVSTYTRP